MNEKILEEFDEKFKNVNDPLPSFRIEQQMAVKSFLTAKLDQARTEEREMVRGEWYLGKKIRTFGKDYIIVGISQMIYDKDCEGEPEWKITKEAQEVALAEYHEGISYQKPSWHEIDKLIHTTTV